MQRDVDSPVVAQFPWRRGHTPYMLHVLALWQTQKLHAVFQVRFRCLLSACSGFLADEQGPQPGVCQVQIRIQKAAVGMAAQAGHLAVTGAGTEGVTAPAAAGACRS